MRRPLLLLLTLGLLAAAAPAAAQSLDLTMTTDLYCGDPPVSGLLGSGWNVAVTGFLCNSTVNTGGNADAYGVLVTTPSQITVTVTASALQVTMLQAPFTPNDCIGGSALQANPTVSVCVPPGYYSILLSSPLRILMPYEVSVTCTPCTPVATQAQTWGALKGSYR